MYQSLNFATYSNKTNAELHLHSEVWHVLLSYKGRERLGIGSTPGREVRVTAYSTKLVEIRLTVL